MATITYARSMTYGSVSITSTSEITADGLKNYIGTLAASTSNQEVQLTIDVSECKAFFAHCTAAATLKTNSSGSPQETFTLAAGVAYQWDNSSGAANPFAGDVTTFYVTCSAGGTLNIWIQEDVTP